MEWSASDELSALRLEIIWKERDGAKPLDNVIGGFGLEVLGVMLRYELGAESEVTFEADGLRCPIGLPLTEAVARVAQVGLRTQ